MKTVGKKQREQQFSLINQQSQDEIQNANEKAIVACQKFLQARPCFEGQNESYQGYIWNKTSKSALSYTCSTEEMESDEHGWNKQNIQIWPEPQFNSTNRLKRRSPLKDITSKVLKQPSKQHFGLLKSELQTFMCSLFPSQKAEGFIRQRKVLRV